MIIVGDRVRDYLSSTNGEVTTITRIFRQNGAVRYECENGHVLNQGYFNPELNPGDRVCPTNNPSLVRTVQIPSNDMRGFSCNEVAGQQNTNSYILYRDENPFGFQVGDEVRIDDDEDPGALHRDQGYTITHIERAQPAHTRTSCRYHGCEFILTLANVGRYYICKFQNNGHVSGTGSIDLGDEVESKYKVTKIGEINEWARLRPTLVSLANAWKQPITICNRDGAKTDVKGERDPGVYIFLYTRPSHVETKNVRARVFPHSVHGLVLPTTAREGFCPDSTASSSLISNGQTTAQLYYHNKAVCILIPLNINAADTAAFFQAVKGQLHTLYQRLMESFTEPELRYVNYLKLNTSTDLQNTIQRAAGLNAQLNTLATQMVALRSQHNAVLRTIDRLKSGDSVSKEQALKEWNKLCGHKYIERIEFPNTNTIRFHTKRFTFKLNDNTERLIGEFKVDISRNNMPRVENKTHRVGGRHHPHCDTSGNMCWGNIYEGLVQLSSNNEVQALIDLVISFLRTCDPKETYGSSIFDFPVVKE